MKLESELRKTEPPRADLGTHVAAIKTDIDGMPKDLVNMRRDYETLKKMNEEHMIQKEAMVFRKSRKIHHEADEVHVTKSHREWGRNIVLSVNHFDDVDSSKKRAFRMLLPYTGPEGLTPELMGVNYRALLICLT
ncbi:hypothetical protein Tco_1177573 [Tanacetum coccineum]